MTDERDEVSGKAPKTRLVWAQASYVSERGCMHTCTFPDLKEAREGDGARVRIPDDDDVSRALWTVRLPAVRLEEPRRRRLLRVERDATVCGELNEWCHAFGADFVEGVVSARAQLVAHLLHERRASLGCGDRQRARVRQSRVLVTSPLHSQEVAAVETLAV